MKGGGELGSDDNYRKLYSDPNFALTPISRWVAGHDAGQGLPPLSGGGRLVLEHQPSADKSLARPAPALERRQRKRPAHLACHFDTIQMRLQQAVEMRQISQGQQ